MGRKQFTAVVPDLILMSRKFATFHPRKAGNLELDGKGRLAMLYIKFADIIQDNRC